MTSAWVPKGVERPAAIYIIRLGGCAAPSAPFVALFIVFSSGVWCHFRWDVLQQPLQVGGLRSHPNVSTREINPPPQLDFRDFRPKIMEFVPKIMDFVLKTMDFARAIPHHSLIFRHIPDRGSCVWSGSALPSAGAVLGWSMARSSSAVSFIYK